MWRLQGAQTQSYGFLLFPCHAAGVLAPNVADIQEYCVCEGVCACTLTHSLLKALWCVFDSQNTHRSHYLCEAERGRRKTSFSVSVSV